MERRKVERKVGRESGARKVGREKWGEESGARKVELRNVG